MNAGSVSVLLVLGGNPVFTAPADLNFKAALEKVATRFHLGLYYDETAEQCHWHAPEAHYLESWGDVRAFDGTVSLIQPLIAPLYDGRTRARSARLGERCRWADADRAGQGVLDARVRRAGGHRADVQGRGGTALRDGRGVLAHALHDGFVRGTSMLACWRHDARRAAGRRAAGSRDCNQRRDSRSSSARIRTSSTAGTRTTGGCRSCRSRSRR